METGTVNSFLYVGKKTARSRQWRLGMMPVPSGAYDKYPLHSVRAVHLEPLRHVGDPDLRIPLGEVASLQLAGLVHVIDAGLLLGLV